MGSIPGWGTKILYAVQYSQKIKKKKKKKGTMVVDSYEFERLRSPIVGHPEVGDPRKASDVV